MQYGRIPPLDRRDSNLDSNGSTPYPHHQSLGQALGTHGTHLPGLSQNGSSSQTHPGAQSSHSPLFSVSTGHTSPGLKRKQVDPIMTQVLKRRRDDDGDTYDVDGNGQGAKHWTDEEKTRLFTWLMGQGQDEHWNALRATKNSCLRECAVEVFGSKKTYQALKGCYERNFNLFKQIYAFESFHSHLGNVRSLSEADRLREYERRLQSARKAECDIGNITARTIDHWHRIGWYNLFLQRWQGDPAATRPSQSRNSTTNSSNPNGGEDPDMDDSHISFSDPVIMSNGINTTSIPPDRSGHPLTYINPQSLRESIIPPSSISPIVPGQQRSGVGVGPGPQPSPSSASNPEQQQPMLNLVIPPAILQTYMQYLQMQTQTSKMKLEYMRRREDREEKESSQRREAERLRMEREAEEFEQKNHKDKIQQKTERALELLQSQIVDDSVKQVAGDFLKKLFTAD